MALCAQSPKLSEQNLFVGDLDMSDTERNLSNKPKRKFLLVKSETGLMLRKIISDENSQKDNQKIRE